MAHSPTFSRLQRLIRIAQFANKHAIADGNDAISAWAEHKSIHRRSFLQSAGTTLAVGAAAPAWVACGGSAKQSTGSTDSGDPATASVIVVGAGTAGLHCAYRLQQAGVDVTVYEASDRVGGRMWTGRDQFADGQVFEIGGELIDSNHATMWLLAEELGITLDDRWVGEPEGFVRELWQVNGTAVSNAVLVEQMIACASVFSSAYEAAETDDDAYATLDAQSLADWLRANVPPDTYRELHDVLSVAYRGEFGLENEEQSCLNLIYLVGFDATDDFYIFGDSDERYHTHGGNDLFPTALAAPLQADNRIVTDAALISVDDTETGYRLTFQRADGTTFEDEAEHVVFALPFTLLREVAINANISDWKREIINELGYGTNAKVMGGFSRRIWHTDYNQGGSMTTDMGVQQTWDTSVGQDGESGILTNFLGGQAGLDAGNGAAEDWFQFILPDLEAVWPGATDAYIPGSAVRMHWPTHRWTKSSYTCYRPGQWAYWASEGEREGNLHFCGEHCSLDFQGWMEGAAETGGLVAAEILDDLGIAHPTGLADMVAEKAQLPQACYHGAQRPRMNPFARRRLARQTWGGRPSKRAPRE